MYGHGEMCAIAHTFVVSIDKNFEITIYDPVNDVDQNRGRLSARNGYAASARLHLGQHDASDLEDAYTGAEPCLSRVAH